MTMSERHRSLQWLKMFLYECHDMIKSLKRARGLLCLVDVLSGWAVPSGTEDGGVTGDGDADSATQSASMDVDAGLTKGVSGTGPGDATGAP